MSKQARLARPWPSRRRSGAGTCPIPGLAVLAALVTLAALVGVPLAGAAPGERRSGSGGLTVAAARGVLAGYLVFDGEIEKVVSFKTPDKAVADRFAAAAVVLGLTPTVIEKAGGRYKVTLPLDSPLPATPNVVPSRLLAGTVDPTERVYFLAAMVECEGGVHGLLLDTPDDAFAHDVVTVLNAAGVHPNWVRRPLVVQLNAPVPEWPIVRSWPYVSLTRVPGSPVPPPTTTTVPAGPPPAATVPAGPPPAATVPAGPPPVR